MKVKKLYFLFFISFGLFAQEKNVSNNVLVVDYRHSIHVKGVPSATVVDATLTANEFADEYEMDFLRQKNFIPEEATDEGSVVGIKSKENDFVFKNFQDRSIYSINRISMKPFLIKDSMKIFKWNVVDEFKEILGYNCQKATTVYGGRNYEAFFTTEMPFQTGPWKFCNLPGLILEVASTDNVLKIVALKMHVEKDDVQIKNPYENKLENSISWSQFIVEYKKKYEEFEHFRGPSGARRSIPKEGIEIYME